MKYLFPLFLLTAVACDGRHPVAYSCEGADCTDDCTVTVEETCVNCVGDECDDMERYGENRAAGCCAGEDCVVTAYYTDDPYVCPAL